MSLIIGAPIAKIKGITGELARENAARNPRRTATTATALIIGVALVGFITVFAASAKASIGKAVDDQFKSDYIIQSGGFGPGAGLSPTLAQQIADLPQVDAVDRRARRATPASTATTRTIGGVDPVAATTLFDLGSVGGSFNDLAQPDTIAVSKRKADDNHWKLGDTIPVTFVKTGVQPLRVAYIFKENTFGDYFVSLDTYEKNYTEQLDFLVFAKLKPGVSAEEGRAAIEPLLKPYPTAKLQDNAQYKADQEAADQPGRAPGVRVAVPRAAHGDDRHREHARAVDPRTHARARAPARGRHAARAGAVDDPMGVGDHRAARHGQRTRHRLVLRLEHREGAARQRLLDVRDRARSADRRGGRPRGREHRRRVVPGAARAAEARRA